MKIHKIATYTVELKGGLLDGMHVAIYELAPTLKIEVLKDMKEIMNQSPKPYQSSPRELLARYDMYCYEKMIDNVFYYEFVKSEAV